MKPKLFLILLIVACSNNIFAQEQATQDKSSASLGQAAGNAVNPLAFVTKLQMQPNYTFKSNDATQFNLTTRIIQPTGSIGLPFIKSKDPSKIYTLYRLEAPIIGQTYPNTPSRNATGLADLVILDVIAVKQKWGFWGLGPNLIIPTATATPIGGGKWCSGLSGVFIYKKQGLMMGILAQQYFSFAGDANRSDRNFMIFQPIVNQILPGGYFIGFSPNFTFDWINNTQTIPLGIQFGKAFAKNLSMMLSPQYTVSGPTKDDFTIQLQLNAMFPPSKKTSK